MKKQNKKLVKLRDDILKSVGEYVVFLTEGMDYGDGCVDIHKEEDFEDIVNIIDNHIETFMNKKEN